MELNDYLKLPYTITLRRDDEGDWVARVQELKGCTAHGSTEVEALEQLHDAKREWIQAALEDHIAIPQPEPEEELPSGKWVQRVPRSLHKNLSRLAKIEGTSLNQLVTSILSDYVGGTRHQATVVNLTGGVTWHPLQIHSATVLTTWTRGNVLGFVEGVANITDVAKYHPSEKVS